MSAWLLVAKILLWLVIAGAVGLLVALIIVLAGREERWAEADKRNGRDLP